MSGLVYALTYCLFGAFILIVMLMGALLLDIVFIIGALIATGFGVMIGAILTYDHWSEEIDEYYRMKADELKA